jgi:hypothetical protein
MKDMMMMMIEKKIKEKVTRRKYWVHPYFNKSIELGSFVVARELHQDSKKSDHFIRDDREKIKILPLFQPPGSFQ